MKEVFLQLSQNKIFLTTLSAWLIAQTIKVGIGIAQKKGLISVYL